MVRDETPADLPAIEALTRAAFQDYPGAGVPEVRIIDALRRDRALFLSLVAVEGSTLIGHAAFSPVRIELSHGQWFGLGPVSVRPDQQGRGVGAALIQIGLERLTRAEAAGCVVLGDPAYYRRFGFVFAGALSFPLAPADHLGASPLRGFTASGRVTYHPAFTD